MDMRTHIAQRTDLARTYAEDGAYFSAARVLSELTGEVEAHARRTYAMLEGNRYAEEDCPGHVASRDDRRASADVAACISTRCDQTIRTTRSTSSAPVRCQSSRGRAEAMSQSTHPDRAAAADMMRQANDRAGFRSKITEAMAEGGEYAAEAVATSLAGCRCRQCGIVHIEPGIEIDGEPLCWMTEDLCSACHDQMQDALEQDAARYRHLRNRRTRKIDIATGGVFAGSVPERMILGGEDLDRAIDAERGLVPYGEPLEARLAECLADCIDAVLLSGRDVCGGFAAPLDIRLGFFKPELSERAAELLEEAGR